jgi:hypothetical protein
MDQILKQTFALAQNKTKILFPFLCILSLPYASENYLEINIYDSKDSLG